MFIRLLSSAVLAAMIAAPAIAQEKAEDAKAEDTKAEDAKPDAAAIEPYEIKRLIIGKQVVIDKAYAEQNGLKEPTPFKLTIPTGEDFLTVLDAKQGGFLKVSFASPDKQFLESIHFVDMDVPADLAESRTAVVAKLMSERVFQNVTQGMQDPKVLSIREIEIGGLGAVEVIGRVTDKNAGLLYLWIVGLPHPVQSKGTYAVATVHFARRPMETDEDFRKTLAGRTLYSFAYSE